MNDVVNAVPTEVSTEVTEQVNSFGITAADVTIPVILLMQSISKAVKERKCFAGDFWDSLDEVVVPQPLEFVPVGMFKQIVTYEDSVKVRSEPWSHAAELTAIADGFMGAKEPKIIQGKKVTKRVSQNYYILLTKDIEDLMPFPKVVRFVKTSGRAGKMLSTHVMKLEGFGHKPWAKTFELTSQSESGDKGEYSVMAIKAGRTSTDEHRKAAEIWFKRLATENVAVHEADEVDEDLVPAGQPEADKNVNTHADINF